MNNKLFAATTAAAVVMLVSGCNIFIDLKPTTIKAQNDLENLEVTVKGVTSDVTAVDLSGVQIADVVFSRIDAGDITEAVETTESGSVDISIEAATATVALVGLGGSKVYQDYTFTGIDDMVTDISDGEDNTVIFNETTAGVVFSALAKKMAK
jgi:hypothetical protein